ncbi:MAG: putative Ig domain-containing protein [Pseudomonadota bacterium]
MQTPCAATGQDGELRMGVSWSASRYADNNNGTVTDTLTGLAWPKDANPAMGAQITRTNDGSALWPDALEFVANLNNNSYLGHNDWRLPNRNELVSLINYSEMTPGVQLNMAGINDIRNQYWSSSSSAADPSYAWNVTMDGEVSELNKYDVRQGSHIWPVRSGIGATPEITQTSTTAVKDLAVAAAAALSITTASLPAGTVGAAYSQTLAATGGTTPYTWSKKSGTLPAGLTLSAAGVISGTPTTAATSTFTIQVKDKLAKTATKSLSITVNAGPLSITTTSLADGYLTTAYSQTLAATGGKSAYTWTITAGTLPAGLTLAASTGKISGIPTSTGNSAITIQVKDANATIVSKPLTIAVYALPSITTSLAAAGVGTAYNQTLTATGGKTPNNWSVSAGTLPAGLSLNASSGAITGTPTTAATSSITFKITDTNAKTATKALSITVSATPPSITTATLNNGTVGVSYSQTLTATGGKTPYSWSRTAGSLPAGLSLSSTGVLSGKPTTSGTSNFTVQVKDGNNSIATKALTIIVTTPLTLDTTQPGYTTVGTLFSFTPSATGGALPYSWSITSGTLPPGLALNSTSGVISGISTTSGWSADFSLQVKDSNNTIASALFSIYTFPPPSIVTANTYDSYVGLAYAQQLIANGGQLPYSWSIISGSLPPGLAMDSSTGKISGTAASTSNSSFTVQVKDANNATATKEYTLAISNYGSVSGVVTDRANGAPIAGVTVSLSLTGITNRNTDDLLYTCNDVLLNTSDYPTIAENDGEKFVCDTVSYLSTENVMQFKARNPFGVADSFTVTWNGTGSLERAYTEYLAQNFKPARNGLLTKASFHLPNNIFGEHGTVKGNIRALLKSKLGGDRGNYLAISNPVSIDNYTSGAPFWIDFTFPNPVQVITGQDYYLEINGLFFDYVGTDGYLYDLQWSGADYVNGTAFNKNGGIWESATGKLAFRTYLDGLLDVTAEPIADITHGMYGGNNPTVDYRIFSPSTSGWTGNIKYH